MFEISLALLVVPCIFAFADWRNGLVLCVVTAFLQDPMRKLTPGQPVFFVVFTGVVFAAAWASALMARVPLGPNAIHGWRRRVGTPFGLFLMLVLAQAAHSYVSIGNPMVPAIGLLSYLAPIPAVVLGYQFAIHRGLEGVRGWMWFYSLGALAVLSSIYLEFAELDWSVLGEVGEGVFISGYAAMLKAYSGFFRASEVAAWHGATTACFLFMLFVGKKFTVPRIIVSIALVAFLISIGILTGRRKMLVEVTIFVAAYMFLVAWFERGTTRTAVLAASFGVVTYLLTIGLVPPDAAEVNARQQQRDALTSKYDQYVDRGGTVFEDLPNRIAGLGFQPILWAAERHGFFGAGLGTGSQGAQHFTGEWNTGSAEGGLGKITLELGVPGLALIGWLLIAFGKYVKELLEATSRISRNHARFAYGLVAFLMANAAAFSVATQVYGDVFVLLLLGWTLGFLPAMPVLALRAARAHRAPAKAAQQRVARSPLRSA